MSVFFLKRNDTRPVLEAQLLDSDGQPVNLSGATVRFLLRSNSVSKVNAAATIVVASEGRVEYVFTAVDTNASGDYRGEFEVTYPGGGVETFPNDRYLKIPIIEDLS